MGGASGAMLAINKYDEFGKPQSTNSGRFQYTGQMWLGELGLHYYKARMYAPHLGRFLQTDPIGYGGSPNLYTYLLNDPVNLTDPLGLEGDSKDPPPPKKPPVICTGTRLPNACGSGGVAPWLNPSSSLPLAGLGASFGNSGLSNGYWYCTNCGVPSPGGDNGSPIVVTAPQYVWRPFPSSTNFGGDYGFMSGMRESFGCIGGAAYVFGASICRARPSGDIYLLPTVGPSSPFVVAAGISPDADAYLSGLSLSGNGFPGGGASFELRGVSGWALQTGTPGFGISLGFNLSATFREMQNYANSLSSWLQNSANVFVGGAADHMYRHIPR